MSSFGTEHWLLQVGELLDLIGTCLPQCCHYHLRFSWHTIQMRIRYSHCHPKNHLIMPAMISTVAVPSPCSLRGTQLGISHSDSKTSPCPATGYDYEYDIHKMTDTPSCFSFFPPCFLVVHTTHCFLFRSSVMVRVCFGTLAWPQQCKTKLVENCLETTAFVCIFP